MKMTSRFALFIGRYAPRGGWRAVRFTAKRDPELWDHAISLSGPMKGTVMRADLRETVSMNFLRHGCIPGQHSHDLLFSALVKDGDTVFDIGANVGYTMLLFGALAGPQGKVIALEPGRRVFETLLRNSAPPRIIALQMAASEREGDAEFHEAEMSDLSSLEWVDGATSFKVPLIRLDTLAKEHGDPDFVKIDVEGHEPAVLRGMEKLLSSSRPPIVMFESLDRNARDSCLAVIRNLARGDYKVLRIGKSGFLSQDLDLAASNDFLFLPAWAEERL